MGKIVVSQFVSVDGVMEGPGGEPDFDRAGWSFQFQRGEDGDAYKIEELRAAEALLLGRKTYESFAGAWPTRTDAEGFADRLNSMPKYVVSSTMQRAGWNNSTVIGLDDIAGLDEDLLVNGSGQLVHALAERDLIDELRLMVFPIILGAGKRLFGDTSHSVRLRLVDARPVGSDGVAIQTYRKR